MKAHLVVGAALCMNQTIHAADIVIEDFESDSYKNWVIEGEASANIPRKARCRTKCPCRGSAVSAL